MAKHRKRICINGHDTFICGRYEGSNRCVQCQIESQRIDPSKDSRIKPICKNGHDTVIVGRDSKGMCNQCSDECKEKYQIENKEKIKKKKHEYYLNNLDKVEKYNRENKERISARRKRHYKNNKKRLLAINKKWREEHRDERREYMRTYMATYIPERLASDLAFKLSRYLRSRLYKAIRGYQKAGSAVKDLGCSIEFLIAYLQEQFYGDMSWDNYGSYWEIDHIEELHTFDLTDRKQFLKAVHYTNLQPMTIPEHQKKTAKNKRK